MNKSELVEVLSEKLGGKPAASQAVEHFVDTVTRAVARGEKVAITGFGVFEKSDRAARTGRNPATGAPVKIKKTSVPKFRPGAEFKAFVSGAKKLAKAAPTPRTATKATKTAARSTAAKAPATKSTAARSTAAKSTAAKAPATKTAAKTLAKKTSAPAKKAAAARTLAKAPATRATKAPAKKVATRVMSAVKAPAKKSPVKKAAATKSPAKKAR